MSADKARASGRAPVPGAASAAQGRAGRPTPVPGAAPAAQGRAGGPTPVPGAEPRLGRRALLRGAGKAAVVGVGLSALLAACGGEEEPGPQARAVAARSIAIDYASYYPPVEQLRRLVREHARARSVRVTFSDDAAGPAAQKEAFRGLTGAQSGFRAVVVAPFDAAALDPLAADAIGRGIAVVSYGVPLAHQSAVVGSDPARAGRLLARDAGRWAATSARDGADVLVVRPPAQRDAPDQFAALARPWEAALLDALAAEAPGLTPVAATTAQGAADAPAAVARALDQYPGVRVVLAWNDATAVGAAQALRRRHPGADWAGLYAGGQGAPALSSARSLAALRADPVLRCLVAPRLRDLAAALVDVPFALLRGEQPPSGTVPLAVLRPGSPQLAAFAADYRR